MIPRVYGDYSDPPLPPPTRGELVVCVCLLVVSVALSLATAFGLAWGLINVVRWGLA